MGWKKSSTIMVKPTKNTETKLIFFLLCLYIFCPKEGNWIKLLTLKRFTLTSVMLLSLKRGKDTLSQGCQTHFHWRPHQPRSCLQRAEIILGPYKCNYSLIVKGLKLHLDFEGNREADEAPGENEFDTPALN